jgi:ribosomal protein S18 acetylase RimI-like enzyme
MIKQYQQLNNNFPEIILQETDSMITSTVERLAFTPALTSSLAQAFLDIFTGAPWNSTMTLNEIYSQITNDSMRHGFDSELIRGNATNKLIGFAWWYDVCYTDLPALLRQTGAYKNDTPRLQGSGSFIVEWGVLEQYRRRGLGRQLLSTALDRIRQKHHWVVIVTNRYAEAARKQLLREGFSTLPSVNAYMSNDICLIKML